MDEEWVYRNMLKTDGNSTKEVQYPERLPGVSYVYSLDWFGLAPLFNGN